MGELSIHCGCHPKPDNSGDYEVNPSGRDGDLLLVCCEYCVLL